MNHDNQHFKKKLQKFSIVKQCPRCKKLSLSYKEKSIICSNCGYTEQIPSLR